MTEQTVKSQTGWYTRPVLFVAGWLASFACRNHDSAPQLIAGALTDRSERASVGNAFASM